MTGLVSLPPGCVACSNTNGWSASWMRKCAST
jgi:hypothetical protein